MTLPKKPEYFAGIKVDGAYERYLERLEEEEKAKNKIKEAGFPTTRFLSEEEQARYKDSIKQFKGKAYDTLNIPKNGSNLFKVVYLNEIGIKTASLSELELALENGLELEGFYEDTPSVVLRSNGDSYALNNYLAKLLAEEVQKRKEETFKHSLVLNGLKLKEDSNSEYGLILVPGEDFSYFEAPELGSENHLKKFSRLGERGMPVFDKEGKRTLYTREDGLSRLYLGVDLDSDSGNVRLANSNEYGRVVVVSPEMAQKNLGDKK